MLDFQKHSHTPWSEGCASRGAQSPGASAIPTSKAEEGPRANLQKLQSSQELFFALKPSGVLVLIELAETRVEPCPDLGGASWPVNVKVMYLTELPPRLT